MIMILFDSTALLHSFLLQCVSPHCHEGEPTANILLSLSDLGAHGGVFV